MGTARHLARARKIDNFSLVEKRVDVEENRPSVSYTAPLLEVVGGIESSAKGLFVGARALQNSDECCETTEFCQSPCTNKQSLSSAFDPTNNLEQRTRRSTVSLKVVKVVSACCVLQLRAIDA
eukprot:g74354.t1